MLKNFGDPKVHKVLTSGDIDEVVYNVREFLCSTRLNGVIVVCLAADALDSTVQAYAQGELDDQDKLNFILGASEFVGTLQTDEENQFNA
jgi:hypothetical protein